MTLSQSPSPALRASAKGTLPHKGGGPVPHSVRSFPSPHLIACGLMGDPVPPVMMSGGPQKKNS